MKRWLRSRKKSEAAAATTTTPGLELLVLEGVDTGQRFSVDAGQTLIGRRLAEAELPGGILLRDATVSSRQAIIRFTDGQYVIEHLAEATNPTLVNGTSIRAAPLVPGSQIQLGRILIDVRSREGTALRDLTQLYAPAVPLARARKAGTHFETEAIDLPTAEVDRSPAAKPPAPPREIGWLELKQATGASAGTRFAIGSDRTRIGRGADCDVRVHDLGVSRQHAELVWEGRELVLYHKSGTNLTTLNRQEVPHRQEVHDRDEIGLAGRLVLSVSIDPSFRSGRAPSETDRPTADEPAGLHAVMEDKAALERRIAEEFSVQGSFLDIGIVNSLGMKENVTEPDRIISSFERLRAFVAGVVSEFAGHSLNSNGDESMCFFADSHDAVRAANAALTRLTEFNRNENLLDDPFRLRVGIHTGQSLVDLERGIAYSPILDLATRLQKLAPANQMAVSEQTIEALPASLPFEWAGTLDRGGFGYYLLEGRIEDTEA
ncbi:MAG: FHA domain-containing protein [bacterium]|nr:FHA domain-containing protein [bacterium]